MEPWAAAENFQASVAVPPAPVRVPSPRPLAPSVTSVANDNDDNEMLYVKINYILQIMSWYISRFPTFNFSLLNFSRN